MFLFLHYIIFIITSLIVFMFSSYLNFTYFFDIYKQWYFNDINDFQLYDFIIGKYINMYISIYIL